MTAIQQTESQRRRTVLGVRPRTDSGPIQWEAGKRRLFPTGNTDREWRSLDPHDGRLSPPMDQRRRRRRRFLETWRGEVMLDGAMVDRRNNDVVQVRGDFYKKENKKNKQQQKKRQAFIVIIPAKVQILLYCNNWVIMRMKTRAQGRGVRGWGGRRRQACGPLGFPFSNLFCCQNLNQDPFPSQPNLAQPSSAQSSPAQSLRDWAANDARTKGQCEDRLDWKRQKLSFTITSPVILSVPM